MTDSRGGKSTVRALSVGLGVALVALAAFAAYLRADKTEVFYAMRGTYADAPVVQIRIGERSTTRLVDLRNRRGDVLARAYLRRPSELTADYRVVLCYAGAKTGAKVLELIPDTPHLVLIGMQYPYRSPRGLWQNLRWPYDVRKAAFRTVAAGMLAVSMIEQDEGLDPARLVVVGSSLGAVFATIHAALDERVPTVVLIHGGGDLPAIIYEKVRVRWLAGPARLGAAVFFHSFEPLRYIDRIAPRRLLMVSARQDTELPREFGDRLYARAGEPKDRIWTDSDHVRSRETELIASIIGQVEAYLDLQIQDGDPDL